MSDYVPPGLGRVLEDLISKHVGKEKTPTALDVHYRHAEQTRRLMAAMQGQQPPEPAYPKRQPQGRLPKTPRKWNAGVGRQAYDWAVANRKSATEAAKQFGINPLLIHSHKRHYGLPPLVDARVTSGKCKRVRRRNEEVKQACRAAYDLARSRVMHPRDAAHKFGLTYQSVIRFCVRNKLPLPQLKTRQES
jgi:hypothetical protein